LAPGAGVGARVGTPSRRGALRPIFACDQWETSSNLGGRKCFSNITPWAVSIGFLHGSAEGPLGIGALLLLALILKWRAR
jgi:hypothetical protein